MPDNYKNTRKAVKILGAGEVEVLADEEFFKVEYVKIKGSECIDFDNYTFHIVNIIKGEASINDESVKIGDNFIIPSCIKSLNINGDVEMIISVGK